MGRVWGTSGEISSAIMKVGEGLWAVMGQFSLDSTARRPTLNETAQGSLTCTGMAFLHTGHPFTSLPNDVCCEFIIPHNHGHPL